MFARMSASDADVSTHQPYTRSAAFWRTRHPRLARTAPAVGQFLYACWGGVRGATRGRGLIGEAQSGARGTRAAGPGGKTLAKAPLPLYVPPFGRVVTAILPFLCFGNKKRTTILRWSSTPIQWRAHVDGGPHSGALVRKLGTCLCDLVALVEHLDRRGVDLAELGLVHRRGEKKPVSR